MSLRSESSYETYYKFSNLKSHPPPLIPQIYLSFLKIALIVILLLNILTLALNILIPATGKDAGYY